MTACSFNIFIIFTVYLSFIFHQSHGFEVIQPQNRTVNPDGTASISCEHTANVSSVKDVRLNSIPPKDKGIVLCQKGRKDCVNITMHKVNPKQWLFIILNIGPDAMSMKYECEFTVKINDLDYTKAGTPTTLLPEQTEKACVHHPQAPLQSHLLRWILICLLALMFVCSCVIISFYIRRRCSKGDPENSTYVEMKKAPRPRNPQTHLSSPLA